MSLRSTLLISSAAVLGAVAWYFFRPDRAFLDSRVSEPPPAETATVLLSGQFTPRAHEGRGLVQVLEFADGQRVLRFSGFETLNGPDLQVYLIGSAAAARRADLESAGYRSLGPLKGNVGDQNYAIPPGTDLVRYRAVAVWCRRFGVNFTTAVLAAPGPAGG